MWHIRALRQNELEEHNDLVYRSYIHGRTLDSGSKSDQMLSQPDWWLKKAATHPWYCVDQTRVMVMDGKLVCSVSCYSRPSFVAGKVVNAACIGSVCTHPDYRRRGLLHQVLKEAIEWMVSQGIMWSFLYGGEDIYGRSGWRVLTSWSLSVDARICNGFGDKVTTRPVNPDKDLGVLADIYEQFNSTRSGPTKRDPQYWDHLVKSEFEPPQYQLLEKDGVPIGYYKSGSEDITKVCEIGWKVFPLEILAFILSRWPDRMIEFSFYSPELLDYLNTIAKPSDQRQSHQHPSAITLRKTYRGLWCYNCDPDCLFPEFSDTDGLINFLQGQNHFMYDEDVW